MDGFWFPWCEYWRVTISLALVVWTRSASNCFNEDVSTQVLIKGSISFFGGNKESYGWKGWYSIVGSRSSLPPPNTNRGHAELIFLTRGTKRGWVTSIISLESRARKLTWGPRSTQEISYTRDFSPISHPLRFPPVFSTATLFSSRKHLLIHGLCENDEITFTQTHSTFH